MWASYEKQGVTRMMRMNKQADLFYAFCSDYRVGIYRDMHLGADSSPS